MLQRLKKTIHEDLTSPQVQEALGDYDLALAYNNFWHYRIVMNPRLNLQGMWFPRSISAKLRTFWNDLRAGKKPIMLLMTPPQHGKSLSVKREDPAFSTAWENAVQISYDKLEGRLYRIAMNADDPVARLAIMDILKNRKGPEWNNVNNSGDRVSGSQTNYFLHMPMQEHIERLERLGLPVPVIESDEGYFRNTTVGGSITGEALDLSIIDDPIKGRAEASSDVLRDKTWDWLTDDVFSRFSESAGLIMIMTRWHVDDPAGRLIAEFGKRITQIRYPAIAEVREQYRKPGDPLFPQLKSLFEKRITDLTNSIEANGRDREIMAWA